MRNLDLAELTLSNLDALRRLVLNAAEEAAAGGRLGSQPPALEEFADLVVHSVLRGLRHGRCSPPPAGGSGLVPGYLRRAEAYLRDHAEGPVSLRDVAAASGCSVRALQLAFRRYRATTPHAALRRLRLERAREELARNGEPVAAIAHRFGFGNASRFASAYARHFGEMPAETRRKHRS